MEAFYKITILVTIVFLILALTVIGILMGKKANVLIYPPVMNECPDYWTFDGSYCIVPNVKCKDEDKKSLNKKIECSQNLLNGIEEIDALTKENTPGYVSTMKDNMTTFKIDFNNKDWKGLCDKNKWAKKYKIVWDGVSNYNSCPS
jgi:hypothetical protein